MSNRESISSSGNVFADLNLPNADDLLAKAELAAKIIAEIQTIQKDARAKGFRQRPRWPMIILRTPKGWTGPRVVDGKQVEGTCDEKRGLSGASQRPVQLKQLGQSVQGGRSEVRQAYSFCLAPVDEALWSHCSPRSDAPPPRSRIWG